MQAHAQLVAVQPGRTRVHLAVGAELDEAVEGFGGRWTAGPDGASGGDVGDGQLFGGADGNRAGDRFDVQDVAGAAVAGGGADAQAAALADGEA